MQKNENFGDVFTNLGDFPLNTDMLNVLMEEFTCHLYGHVKQNDIHEVIKCHFEQNLNLTALKNP